MCTLDFSKQKTLTRQQASQLGHTFSPLIANQPPVVEERWLNPRGKAFRGHGAVVTSPSRALAYAQFASPASALGLGAKFRINFYVHLVRTAKKT